MKAIIIIVVVLTAVFAVSLLTQNFLTVSAHSIDQELKLLEHSIRTGKWNEAKAQLGVVEGRWDSIKDKWAMVLDHQEIDNIELSLVRMGVYVDKSDPVQSLAEISALVMLFEHIPEKEALSWKNIL